MPAIGFTYPDGEQITFTDAFDHEMLDEWKMGITREALLEMAKQRNKDRPPSTTELLKGALEAYLLRTVDYFIDPQSHAYALTGTLHHAILERNADGKVAEKFFNGFEITGIVDLYDKRTKTLTDYKNFGSYKACLLLGMDSLMIDDPSGERYKRKSKYGNIGQIKKIKHFFRNPDKIDFGDVSWQINFYRRLLELNGKEVEKMRVQITVRDGGLEIAKRRGVTRNIYLIDVPFIHNDKIDRFFTERRDALLHSLETDELPDKCDDEDTWSGRKCQSFCDVRHMCPHAGG